MTQELKQRRIECNYHAENARFLLDCDFSKQYDGYYRKRFEKTRPFIEYNCRCKWDPSIPIYSLSEVANFTSTSELLHADVNSQSLPLSQSSNEPFYYKFNKRIRKLSEQSPASRDQPRTSTQNRAQDQEPIFSDDDLDSASPILVAPHRGPNVGASPSLRKPVGSKSAQCIVVGTIFKRMKLQPDVVAELSKGDFQVKCEKYLGHYTSQDDTLVLEDHEESIQLVGNINPKNFVTGVVVALLGVSIDDGSQFMVFDICFAEPNRDLLYDDEAMCIVANQPQLPSRIDAVNRQSYLMIVSDLGFHHDMDKNVKLTRALQDMIDFIWGGTKFSDDPRSSKVARILVAGNSLHEDRFSEEDDDQEEQAASSGQDEIMSKMKQSRQVKHYSKSIQAAKHMDDFFAQLSKTIHVDVMPGPSDPSSHLMPQQPFHPCMFPQASTFSTFNCTTNPHHAIYNDVEILATSGQNVDIIKKFSGFEDSIDIMKCHLMWGNSAPSAPDNLYSVPYEDEDPFVIDFIPDVYVVGCQDEFRTEYHHFTSNNMQDKDSTLDKSRFETQTHTFAPNSNLKNSIDEKRNITVPENSCGTPKIEGNFSDSNERFRQSATNSNDSIKKRRTLLVSVPKFSDTFSCVLLDLVSLESRLVTFK